MLPNSTDNEELEDSTRHGQDIWIRDPPYPPYRSRRQRPTESAATLVARGGASRLQVASLKKP